MKKKLLFLLISTTLLATGCKNNAANKSANFLSQSKTVLTREEESIEQPTSTLVGDLEENDYYQLPVNLVCKLYSSKSYKAITLGSSETNVPLVGDVTQKIDALAIKGEYSYFYNSSSSSTYTSEHEAFYYNDQAVYKNKNDKKYTTSSLRNYLNKYGIFPFGLSIEGYKVSRSSITSITKLPDEGDYYRFKIVFDKDKATNNVRIQMKALGDLTDYPVFSEIEMVLTIENDYTPIKIDFSAKYKSKKVVETSCHQQYTVTYSQFGETIDIPNLDNVKGLFN